jgi:hypothetical protein
MAPTALGVRQEAPGVRRVLQVGLGARREDRGVLQAGLGARQADRGVLQAGLGARQAVRTARMAPRVAPPVHQAVGEASRCIHRLGRKPQPRITARLRQGAGLGTRQNETNR